MITATIYSEKWWANVQERARTLKVNVRDIMKSEARLYSVQMVRLTPPTNPKRLKGKDGKKLSDNVMGTNAARREVLRAMTPADPDWPDSPLKTVDKATQRRLTKYALEGNQKKFLDVIHDFGKFKNWRVEQFSPALHLKAKGSRGRVHASKRIFIIGNSQISAFWQYMVKTLSHVGRLKAGWLPAVERLGGKITDRWIVRHRSGARGRCEVHLEGNHPRIVIANSAMGVGQLQHLSTNVFRIRATAIKRGLRQALKNLAAIGRGGGLVMLPNPNAKASALDQMRDAVYSTDS